MTLRKKAVAIVLSAFLAGSLLAGCAATKETKKEPDQPAAPKVVELVFWEQEEAAEKVFDPILQKFMDANKNIKITRVHYETEKLRTNFLTAVQGNQGPQVVFGPDDNVGVFATAGVIQPLDSFFDASFLSTLNKTALDGNRLNGKLWGVPDRIGNQLMLIYNKALIPNAPANTDAVYKFAADFKAKNADKYALVFNQTEPFWLAPWLGAYGGSVFNDKNEPTLDTPAMVSAFKLMQDLKAKGVIPKESDYDAAEALFKDGKAAMIINGPWSVGGYLDKKMDIGIAKIPQVSGAGWPKPYTSTKAYFVSKLVTDKDMKDAVKTFIQYMNSEETQKTLAAIHKQWPTNTKANESDVIKNDPVMKQAAAQLESATPMPIIAQMRVVWDTWKPQMQLVIAGQATPEKAAKDAQADCVKKIAEMK
ncbi:MAG TPA: extracellular solute-binding protein [Symbiobacteriaceae bacterium]